MRESLVTILAVIFGTFIGVGIGFWGASAIVKGIPVTGEEGLHLYYTITIFFTLLPAFSGGLLAYSVITGIRSYRWRKKVEAAIEATKAKDEFISMMLHHLRTPLAGMRWMIGEVLNGKRYPPDVKELFEALLRTNKRALFAVTHLMNVARANMERLQYNFTDTSVKDLEKLIKENAEMLAPEFKDRNIEFDISLTRKPGTLKIDLEKIVTSIQTLVENALHYTREGGKVYLHIQRDDKSLQIVVGDTGIGIPQSEKRRIFEQFYRGETAKRVNPEGLGVGLFMVQTFVERHRGKILLDSEVGKGTKFTVTLPLASLEDPKVVSTGEQEIGTRA